MTASKRGEAPVGPYDVDVGGVEEQLGLWSVNVAAWNYRIDEHYVKEGRAYRTHVFELSADNRAVRSCLLSFDMLHWSEEKLIGVELFSLSQRDWTTERPPRAVGIDGLDGFGRLDLEPGGIVTHSELVASKIPLGLDPDTDPYDASLKWDLDLPGPLADTLFAADIGYVGQLLEQTPEDLLRLPRMSDKRLRLLRDVLQLHRFDWV